MGLNPFALRTRHLSEDRHHILTLYMENDSIKSILDTGAGHSVVIKNRDPTLPRSRGPPVQGVGRQWDSLKSTVLNRTDEDSSSGTVQPHIVPGRSYNLWGSDIL